MATDATFFVAKPLSELLELFRNMIHDEFNKFSTKPAQTPPVELMSIDETCKFLQVSKVTIHKWKKKKLIVSHRIGRRIYFKKQELLEAMNSMTSKRK